MKIAGQVHATSTETMKKGDVYWDKVSYEYKCICCYILLKLYRK